MAVAESVVSQTATGHLEPDRPDDLARVLSVFTFESARPAELAGKLLEIQGAYACLIARYLKAALKATQKLTLDNPDGQILIHPAMKLITGDRRLSASKAADMIKRLLGICPEAVEPLLSDPILKEAYETALRLRPRQQKPRERDGRS